MRPQGRHSMKRARALVLLVAVIVIVMSACSSDGDSDSVKVTATDYEFSPDSWTIKANTETPITVKNDAQIEHEWVIMKTEIMSEDEFAEDKVLWETEAEAGESKSDTIPALEAGTYQIICGLEGHFSAGMKGTLTVEE